MADANIYKGSFNSGEIAPSMYGQVNMTQYLNGAKKILNYIPKPQGGLDNRPGTIFALDLGGGYDEGGFFTETGGRLISFSYNTEQSYHLLFTDEVMRVIKDGEFVLRPLNTSGWMWTQSTYHPEAQYLTTAAGGDPGIPQPSYNEFYYQGYLSRFDSGLNPEDGWGDWVWGDFDSLGFNTIYFWPPARDFPSAGDGVNMAQRIPGVGSAFISATSGNDLTVSYSGADAAYADTAGLTLSIAAASSTDAYIAETVGNNIEVEFIGGQTYQLTPDTPFLESDEGRDIVFIDAAGNVLMRFDFVTWSVVDGSAFCFLGDGVYQGDATYTGGTWGFSDEDIILPGAYDLTSSGSFFSSGAVNKSINIINTAGIIQAVFNVISYTSATEVTANLTSGTLPSSPVAASLWDFSTNDPVIPGNYTLTCEDPYFTVGTPDVGEEVIIISEAGSIIGRVLITATASTTEVTATYVGGQVFSVDGRKWGKATETITPGNSSYTYCCVSRIESPYAEQDLDLLKVAQTADVMYIDHPDYPPTVLSRSDHWDWTFTEENYDALPCPITDFAGVHSNGTPEHASNQRTMKYKISAVMEDGEEETLPSTEIEVIVNRPWKEGATVELTWTAVPDASSYRIYKSSRGFYGWIGTVHADTGVTEYSDDNIDPDVSDSHRRENNPFASENYPTCPAIFQQRMVHGGLKNNPTQLNGSVTGIWDNFTESRPLQADDSFEATLASMQVDEIRHLVPLNGLAILTSGSEWVMRPGVNDNAVSPTSMRLDVQSYRGCSHVPPLTVGSTVLFNSRDGRVVYDFGYFFSSDRYETQDMTVLAQHLFEGRTIKEWAYQQKPNSVVWCVMSDGTLLSFTYVKEQDVWAWAQHETDGSFESVSCIPGKEDLFDPIGRDDQVAFIVNRYRGGYDIACVEFLAGRAPNTNLDVFLDSALWNWAAAGATTLTGMDHLEGKEVWVTANDIVIKGLQVINGEVALGTTLSAGGYVVCGLPIPTPTVELLPFEHPEAYGKKRVIKKVVVRLENTRGLWAGQDTDHMYEAKWRTGGTLTAEPDTLFSGDKEVLPGTKWGFQTSLVLQQQDPLPQTISAVIPEVDFGG